MKKLLLVLTAIAVSLAFVGASFAAGPICCPPVKTKMVTEYKKPGPVAPCLVPKPYKPTAPKCITTCNGCVTVPGSKYALWERPVMVKTKVMKDVYQDLCVGKSKGKCMPCGFCVPVKWDCKWKTSVICGKVEVVTCKVEKETYPIKAKCVPVPTPPPDCY
jgi:hypothetical protein